MTTQDPEVLSSHRMETLSRAKALHAAAAGLLSMSSIFGSSKHRLARRYKFAGEQRRKAAVARSRRQMRKMNQRRNRGR